MALSLCSVVQCSLTTTIIAAIRSVIGGLILYILSNTKYFHWSILLKLSNTQYFWVVYTTYTNSFIVFGWSILLILINLQYLGGSILKGTGAYYVKNTRIILSVYQYSYYTRRTLEGEFSWQCRAFALNGEVTIATELCL